ncbi:hypothetical protein [Collimonas arenae]|uniref:hypothetical protein n=1 Tax=Collimonas arenae TaxID=279058 RepID=UPI0012E07A82|nr:hypothetical protein [Collimonas arenae]
MLEILLICIGVIGVGISIIANLFFSPSEYANPADSGSQQKPAALFGKPGRGAAWPDSDR